MNLDIKKLIEQKIQIEITNVITKNIESDSIKFTIASMAFSEFNKSVLKIIASFFSQINYEEE